MRSGPVARHPGRQPEQRAGQRRDGPALGGGGSRGRRTHRPHRPDRRPAPATGRRSRQHHGAADPAGRGGKQCGGNPLALRGTAPGIRSVPTSDLSSAERPRLDSLALVAYKEQNRNTV
ncbi:hypothetical protein DCO57_17125 [Labrenzia sp. 011]|nr:hypothetical protein DCO57_17125 [Labrenzia sp. 011]